jgi:hypothetical protein
VLHGGDWLKWLLARESGYVLKLFRRFLYSMPRGITHFISDIRRCLREGRSGALSKDWSVVLYTRF